MPLEKTYQSDFRVVIPAGGVHRADVPDANFWHVVSTGGKPMQLILDGGNAFTVYGGDNSTTTLRHRVERVEVAPGVYQGVAVPQYEEFTKVEVRNPNDTAVEIFFRHANGEFKTNAKTSISEFISETRQVQATPDQMDTALVVVYPDAPVSVSADTPGVERVFVQIVSGDDVVYLRPNNAAANDGSGIALAGVGEFIELGFSGELFAYNSGAVPVVLSVTRFFF